MGRVMTQGWLKSRNIHVPRDRIAAWLKKYDPDGVKFRQRRVLKRRVYKVQV